MAVAAKTIPRAAGEPLVGNMQRFNRDRLEFLTEMARTCPDIGLTRLGPMRAAVINDPALVGEVLVDKGASFGKSTLFLRALRLTAGDNLLTLEGERHRRHRRVMAPALTPRHVAAYAATMVDHAAGRARSWGDGATVDLVAESTLLTMSIATKTLFDIDISPEAEVLSAAIANNMAYVDYLTRHLIVPPLWVPTRRNRRTRRTLALVTDRIHAMIVERRADPGLAERDDLPSRLVLARDEDGSALDVEELCGEAITLFVAGHETTARTVSWALYEVCRAPAVGACVRAEIDAVLEGRLPTAADLPRLPYTSQVIKETLRLHPPGYFLGRPALQDVEIGGYALPRGTLVFVSAYTMHRRPDLYPEPLAFRPERFAGALEKTLPRHAYLPFGAGAHICIGSHFAGMEAHLLLVTLLQANAFTLAEEREVRAVPRFVLVPDGPMRAVVRRRG
ncbi:MAG: cytochrome P450 [Chloroflexota bacterium]